MTYLSITSESWHFFIYKGLFFNSFHRSCHFFHFAESYFPLHHTYSLTLSLHKKRMQTTKFFKKFLLLYFLVQISIAWLFQACENISLNRIACIIFTSLWLGLKNMKNYFILKDYFRFIRYWCKVSFLSIYKEIITYGLLR